MSINIRKNGLDRGRFVILIIPCTFSQSQSGSQHGQARDFPTVEDFLVKNIHACSAHFLGIDGDAGEGRIDLLGQASVVKGNEVDTVWQIDSSFLEGTEGTDG